MSAKLFSVVVIIVTVNLNSMKVESWRDIGRDRLYPELRVVHTPILGKLRKLLSSEFIRVIRITTN